MLRRSNCRNFWRVAGLSVGLATVLTGGIGGCALGRSNVSIDSNSRAPWMNLEFLPSRKKADPSNYHRSVAENRSATPSAPTAEVTTAAPPAKKETRLANWLTPGGERTPLPLPRSDIAGDAGNSTASTPAWWGFE